MTTQAQSHSASSADDPVSNYRQHSKRLRLEGALLTLLAALGCCGLTFGCYLAWDILEANGELRVIPLFVMSFSFLLFVVHRLGRTAEPIWAETLGDVKALGASREGPPK